MTVHQVKAEYLTEESCRPFAQVLGAKDQPPSYWK